jgi:hypothetical protein
MSIYTQHIDLFKDVTKYTLINRYQRLGENKNSVRTLQKANPLPLHWSIVTAVQGNDRYSLRKSHETNAVFGKTAELLRITASGHQWDLST